MNITLISLDRELFCIGIRILSASLRQAGHRVRCVFLPPQSTNDVKTPRFQVRYSFKLLDEVQNLCKDAQVIGLSLMTNQFIQAISVSEHLKRNGVSTPIIWGGIQPTVEPEVCLQYADIVCLGEGEAALLELVEHMENNRPYYETKNMWFNSETGIIRNPLRSLEQDLDRIPLPDYSCQDHFISHGDYIEELTVDRLVKFEGDRFRAQEKGLRYPIMTSRGCPFSCAYCCNSVYASLYPKQRRLRWRSVDNVISELKMIQTEVAPISFVYIVDDNFVAQSQSSLDTFCERYKKEIGIPFSCQVSPLTVTAEKLNSLLGAGCAKVTMGVETGNKRVAELYNRGQFHQAVPTAIALVEKYRPQMSQPPTYQFIIDNPYETLDETLETLRLACSLPRPWHNPIYSLMLFPGTPLYERAEQDGLIIDKQSQIYGRNWRDYSKPFFQIWARLYRANMPPLLLRALLLPWVARLLTSNVFDVILRMRILRWLWVE